MCCPSKNPGFVLAPAKQADVHYTSVFEPVLIRKNRGQRGFPEGVRFETTGAVFIRSMDVRRRWIIATLQKSCLWNSVSEESVK